MKLYEEYKGVFTKKGKTAAINKVKEMSWHKIDVRLNVNLQVGSDGLKVRGVNLIPGG